MVTEYQVPPVNRLEKIGAAMYYVKNISSMAPIMGDCGLDYSPMSQMVCSHVKKLANENDV